MSSPQGYTRHFVACNQCNDERFVPFYIDGTVYGYVTKKLCDLLPRTTGVFNWYQDGISLMTTFNTFEMRSEALMEASAWIAQHYKKQLRNEMYPIISQWNEEPLAQIDRAAVPWFGIRAWGVHVNGFVKRANGLHLWIGKRAADRPADPGKLDNLIGGGQPIGLTLEENLCKEAKEEAGIEPPLALTAKLVRTLDYQLERPDGMRRDTLFIYDLELPEGFIPQNTDGEVEAFYLMPLEEVSKIVKETDTFKFNCNLVIADFMVRHNFITPRDEEYHELANWLNDKEAISA